MTGKEVVRVVQRKRFGNFQCCVLPTLSSRRKTDTRRKPRRNDNNPLIPKLASEADTGFREGAVERQGQIFSMLEKLSVFAPKLQDALR